MVLRSPSPATGGVGEGQQGGKWMGNVGTLLSSHWFHSSPKYLC